jgi:hypothetical protein
MNYIRNILFLSAMLAMASIADAQTVKMTKLILSNFPFTSGTADTNFVAATNLQIPTAKAAKKYADRHLGTRKLSTVAPLPGQVMTWNDALSQWEPDTLLTDPDLRIIAQVSAIPDAAGIELNHQILPNLDLVGQDGLFFDPATSSQINGGIKDTGIVAAKIATGAITTAKLAAAAVTAAKLAQMGAASGQILRWNGTAWAPANNAGIAEYVVSITGGNAGTSLRIVASGTGVTAAYAGGELTVTVPDGVTLLSANYRGTLSDIQGGADAGGAVNWVRVKFAGLAGNTSTADMRIPVAQKTIFASAGPSLTAPFTINQSNNPAQAVVGVSSGSITLRFAGMSGATNGYQLTFSGF